MGITLSCLIPDDPVEISDRYHRTILEADSTYAKAIFAAELSRHRSLALLKAQVSHFPTIQKLELDTPPVDLNHNMRRTLTHLLREVDPGTRNAIGSRYGHYDL